MHFLFRCYLRFDIIRRILVNYFKINVVQVMGITDVDDKIIQKANYVSCTNYLSVVMTPDLKYSNLMYCFSYTFLL